MEFLKVDSLDTAREKLLRSAEGWLAASETLPLERALGRIAAADISAAGDIPSFRRSTVDGYAVVSGDTAAAGENIPSFLTVKDRVEMGKPAIVSICSGECAEIPTGGMLPEGADAVVMTEYAEAFGEDGVALYHSASYGENVVSVGEDAKSGAVLLRRGKRILPQDIGVLAAAGAVTVPVYAKPRITVISTGDELVAPKQNPAPGQIRDVNTYALCALAEKRGFSVVGAAVLPDEENSLKQAFLKAMETSDIVVASGGSSKGKKDITRLVMERISSPGVYTHGIAVKPGKPTILGCDEASRTLLAGLPGHPVSAMMVFELLFGWLIREVTGCAAAPAIPARISDNLASSPGKLTCWPVSLEWLEGEYIARPIYGRSGLVTTLARADGYFTVDRNTEGLKAGEMVTVNLF